MTIPLDELGGLPWERRHPCLLLSSGFSACGEAGKDACAPRRCSQEVVLRAGLIQDCRVKSEHPRMSIEEFELLPIRPGWKYEQSGSANSDLA